MRATADRARRTPRQRRPRDFSEIVRRAHATRRSRARVIIARAVELLPNYRGLSGARLADVRRSVLHHLGLFYRVTLEAGRPLGAEDLEPSRRLARRRAAQGVPLGEFLTFFQVGLSVIWEHLMQGASPTPALRERLLERVGTIVSNQALLMAALVEAYVEERERLSRFRERDLDELLQLLLEEDADESALEARARSLGIPIEQRHAVAILGVPSAALDAFRERSGARPGDGIWLGRSREGVVGVMRGADQAVALAALARALPAGSRLGVGRAAAGVAGLRGSAREALRALRLGSMLRGLGPVHHYAELEMLDLAQAGTPRARDFVQSVLGPLLLDGSARTHLETLRQLAANGHRIKLAAAALGVHPHTLSYRLKQIRRRAGIDADDPEMRLRVHLALRLLDAQGSTSEGAPGRRRKRPPRLR
jgi:hypothetical protein